MPGLMGWTWDTPAAPVGGALFGVPGSCCCNAAEGGPPVAAVSVLGGVPVETCPAVVPVMGFGPPFAAVSVLWSMPLGTTPVGGVVVVPIPGGPPPEWGRHRRLNMPI